MTNSTHYVFSLCRGFLKLSFIFFFLASCQEDEEIGRHDITVNLSGYMQKGPFLNGSGITLIELDNTFQPTGKTFTTEIQDNNGSFSLSGITIVSPYVQLVGEGFYYNEVLGEESSAPLTLRSIVDITNHSNINLNVLLHLQSERVEYLIKQGKSFEEAKTQTQQEILSVFGIEKTNTVDASSMDISKEGDDNAILLAISATLQGQNSVAELSELMANIISDMKEDGKLDDQNAIEKIRAGGRYVSAESIKEHLIKRYKELGKEVSLPNFEKYLDKDGDGVINSEDDETPNEFSFTAITEAKMDTFYISETITLQGLSSPTESWLSGEGVSLIVNGEEKENGISLTEGDEIAIKMQIDPDYSTTYTAEFTLGEFTTNWTVTTVSSPFQLIGYPGHSQYYMKTFVAGESVFAGLGADISFAQRNEWYAYDIENNKWVEKADFPGNPDIDMTISVNDKFYAGLGENGKALWEYNPTSDSWTAIADFPGQANDIFTYATDTKWYAGLGDNGNAIWEYDASTNSWLSIDDFPVATSDVDAFKIEDEVFALVSFQETTGGEEIWKFNAANKSWGKVTDADASDFLFTLGGKGFFATENSTDLLTFSPGSASWATVATLPEANPKFGFTIKGKGYLYFDNNFKNTLYVYDPANNTLRQIRGIEQELRGFTLAVTTERHAFLKTDVSTAQGSSFYQFAPLQE